MWILQFKQIDITLKNNIYLYAKYNIHTNENTNVTRRDKPCLNASCEEHNLVNELRHF